MASLLLECTELLADDIVANFDVVVVDVVFVVKLGLELGRDGDVEDESEVILLFDVLRCLLFAAEGFAKHVNLLALDIVEKAVLQKFVYFVSLNLGTVHFLNKTCGNVTGTEAGHLYLFA